MARRKRPRNVQVGSHQAQAIRGPSGEGAFYWRAIWSEDGVRRTKALGWMSREQANDALLELVTSGPDEPQGDGAVRTVTDLLECWIAAQDARRDSGEIAGGTHYSYERASKALKKRIGKVPLERLNRAALERYVSAARKHFAPTTVNLHLRVLGVAYRWGQDIGIAPAAALPRIKAKVRGPVNCHYTPSEEEVARVLVHLKGWSLLVAQLLAATGTRIGEIVSLTWGDVDLEGGWIKVTGKSGTRELPVLSDSALSALRFAYAEAGEPEPQQRVVPRAERTVRLGMIRHLARACALAKVERFTSHGLRRLAVDTFARNGVEVSAAAAYLGHSPEVMWRYYRQVTRDDLAQLRTQVRLGPEQKQGQVVPFPCKK